MKIARKLRTDKRSKMRVKADVLATKVILQIDNLSLKLSHVEARRVATTLEKAVNIQLTHREKTISSSFWAAMQQPGYGVEWFKPGTYITSC